MNINVVLTRTIYAGNIGYVARVMANMGSARLILVAPRCEINSQARKTAAGAQETLDQIKIYPTWDDFYANEGHGLRIAFCCREGKNRALKDFREHMKTVTEFHEKDPVENVYLIFGPEDNGLETPEMEMTNLRARLPTFGPYQSMNLSHAVMLALYIWQDAMAAKARVRKKTFNLREEKRQQVYFPEETILEWIRAMGMDPDKRKSSAYLTLKRVLLQNLPQDYDLMIFESVIKHNIRKLQEAQGIESPADNPELS